MPENKKHHFVPRFYLRRFSPDEKSISIFNVGSGKLIESSNLKNQCYRDYFYGKDQRIEKSLVGIEGAASEVIREIVQSPLGLVDFSADHNLLLVYIAVQHGRTKYAADVANEMGDRLMKYALQHEFAKLDADPDDFEFVAEDAASISLRYTAMAQPLLVDLRSKLLRIATDGAYFITSDAPVVLYNQFMEVDLFGSNCGFAAKGLQIFFPLGPKHLLMFYDEKIYAVGGKRTGVVDIRSATDVDQLNALQLISADENVYLPVPDHGIHNLFAGFKRHRRKVKSAMTIIPQDPIRGLKNEIITSSREDVKTGLQISFVRTLKSARAWKSELHRTESIRPGMLMRNERLVRDHEKFVEDANAGKVGPGDFKDWLRAKYGIPRR